MASSEERLPRQLGRYIVVEHLATGGMGAVFFALQSTRFHGLDRPCVVKTVRANYASSRTIIDRFLDEARTSLLLNHKNLCSTIDVDEAGGVILLAMEHIAGRNLRDVYERAVEDSNALSIEEIVAIGVETLEGLEFAHNLANPRTGQSLGLVHRDISPQNVMISFSGDVKVIDFGVARSRMQTSQTAQGAIVGKFRYMAAEQMAGDVVDRRADVACVGLMLIELLAGMRFYEGVPLEKIITCWHGAEPWRSPALDRVPATLQPVLERAIEAEPRGRFGSAAAFRDALTAVAGVPRAGVLKRTMARLFPGQEEAWKQHLQSMYRSAEDFVAAKPRVTDIADAATRARAFSGSDSRPAAALDETVRMHSGEVATLRDRALSASPAVRPLEPEGEAARRALSEADTLHTPAQLPADARTHAEPSSRSTGPGTEEQSQARTTATNEAEAPPTDPHATRVTTVSSAPRDPRTLDNGDGPTTLPVPPSRNESAVQDPLPTRIARSTTHSAVLLAAIGLAALLLVIAGLTRTDDEKRQAHDDSMARSAADAAAAGHDDEKGAEAALPSAADKEGPLTERPGSTRSGTAGSEPNAMASSSRFDGGVPLGERESSSTLSQATSTKAPKSHSSLTAAAAAAAAGGPPAPSSASSSSSSASSVSSVSLTPSASSASSNSSPPTTTQSQVSPSTAPAISAPASATEQLPQRPRPLGERIRYLERRCAERAETCRADVLKRATSLGVLPPADIARLSADTEACLDRCGAPR